MAVTTPDAFFDLLEQSELLDDDQLARARKLVGEVERPKDAARRLVKEGVLTNWQASMLISGRHNLHVGRYRLLDQFTSSDAGYVFLAEHVQMGRRVTLRTLSKLQTKDPDTLKRFLADARQIASLDHRNLVHAYDVDHDGDRYFLVSEFVEGRNLQALVEKIGPLEPERAIRYVQAAALGLAHAHEHGILHGDLHPANLLIDGQDIVHVVDVGVARIADTGEGATQYQAPERANSNADGSIQDGSPQDGSPQDGSPQDGSTQDGSPQDGSTQDGIAADVFSLGATFAYLLTGRPRIGQDAKVDPRLQKIYQFMTAPNPQQRCRSMSDVARLLEHWQEDPMSREATASSGKNGKGKGGASGGATRKPPIKATNPRISILPAPGGANDPLFGGVDADPLGAAAAPTSGAASSPKSPPTKPAASPQKVQRKIPPWMILAGSAGALVALLLLVGIVALAAWLRGSGGDEVAQNQPADMTESALDPESIDPESIDPEAAGPKDPEANDPETDDPEASAGTTAEVDAATDDGGEAADGSPAATAVEPMPPSPETPAAPETPVTSVGPTDPATPTGAKPETTQATPPKTDDPKPAPTPPKPVPPKPAPPANPFRKLTASVDLPALGEKDAPAAGAFEPQPLGELFVKPGELFFMEMHGGEFAAIGTRTFTLVPNLTTERDWDVMLSRGAQDDLKVAALAARDDKLLFQWMPEASEESAALNVSNCVLGMRTGLAAHMLALRKPQEIEPMQFELSKAIGKVDYTIENAPAPEKIVLEIAAVEGLPEHSYDPEQKIPVDGETIYMRFGAGPQQVFSLKTDSNLRKGLRSTVNLTTTASYKLEQMPRDERYLDKEVRNLQQQLNAQRQQGAVLIEQWTKQFQAKGTPKPQKDQLNNQILRGQTALGQLDNQIKQVDALIAQYESFGAGGTIHFRIYYLAGEQQVDLVRSKSLPAPAKAASAKAAPARPAAAPARAAAAAAK